MIEFRIVHDRTPVATVRAETRDDAVAAFRAGSDVPDGVEFAAYPVTALAVRSPHS